MSLRLSVVVLCDQLYLILFRFKITKKAGQSNTTQLFFLNWAKQYFSEQGVTDNEVWQALESAFFPHHHPKLYQLQQSYYWLINKLENEMIESKIDFYDLEISDIRKDDQLTDVSIVKGIKPISTRLVDLPKLSPIRFVFQRWNTRQQSVCLRYSTYTCFAVGVKRLWFGIFRGAIRVC